MSFTGECCVPALLHLQDCSSEVVALHQTPCDWAQCRLPRMNWKFVSHQLPRATCKCVQEPYRFLAVYASLEMVRALGRKLDCLVGSLVPPLRVVLQRHEPTSVASVCLVLAQMLRSSPRCFAVALVPHFWQPAQGLGLFYTDHRELSLGYNSGRVCTVHECVDSVLQLLVDGAGDAAAKVVQRSIPVFCRVHMR